MASHSNVKTSNYGHIIMQIHPNIKTIWNGEEHIWYIYDQSQHRWIHTSSEKIRSIVFGSHMRYHMRLHKINETETIKECAEYVCDYDFFNKLDENEHLIGFDNGVYDLITNIFREGRPEDYISLSTGYSYKR